jgi:hypothetical protein
LSSTYSSHFSSNAENDGIEIHLSPSLFYLFSLSLSISLYT